MTICVFASSSNRINNEYATAASNLGLLLAKAKMEVVYGGGGIGLMGKLADAVVALPGGIGTLEELTEALTLNFYKSFVDFLEHMIAGYFLRHEHQGMWKIAETPEEVMVYLLKKEDWLRDPGSIARI